VPHRDVIVVGASAGGVEALRELVRGLPEDLPASVIIVIHLPPASPSMLAGILSRAGRLPAEHARDGEPLRPGRIFVAPPDVHTILDGDTVRLARGPRENLHRPAIDPLFRSAAVGHGRRVIGVVLTGALDDGTAGLGAIKRMGGVAVVQDPADALYPSMPQSALRNVKVDHCLPLSEMPALLDRLTREAMTDSPVPAAPIDMKMEVGMAQMDSSADELDQIAERSTFTCPECQGTLWEMRDKQALRYRCHVGHAYSGESLISQQSSNLEDALWAAVRAFEENAKLAQKMAERCSAQGHREVEERFTRRAETARGRADEIRHLLEKIDLVTEPTA